MQADAAGSDSGSSSSSESGEASSSTSSSDDDEPEVMRAKTSGTLAAEDSTEGTSKQGGEGDIRKIPRVPKDMAVKIAKAWKNRNFAMKVTYDESGSCTVNLYKIMRSEKRRIR